MSLCSMVTAYRIPGPAYMKLNMEGVEFMGEIGSGWNHPKPDELALRAAIGEMTVRLRGCLGSVWPLPGHCRWPIREVTTTA